VNRSSAAGNSRCPPLVKVATVSRSVRAVPRRPISSSALASSAVIASLASASTRPASVSSTPRVLRRTTATPSPRSSALICWETADGVNRSAAAARLKLPCRATSRRTASRRTSIISSPQPRHQPAQPIARRSGHHHADRRSLRGPDRVEEAGEARAVDLKTFLARVIKSSVISFDVDANRVMKHDKVFLP
jgi:hypothetical protein